MEKKVNTTIFLIRGLTRESGHWGEFPDSLKKINREVSIQFIDLPGSGKFVNKKSPISISKIVDFLRSEILIDKSQTNILLASSLGGIVAMNWVIRFPNDFNGIVTLSSTYKGVCKTFERMKPQMWLEIIALMFTSNLSKREQIILNFNSNNDSFKSKNLEKWVEIQKNRKMTRSNMIRQSIAGLRFNFKTKPEINVPLLIVGSKSDKLVCVKCIKKTHAFLGGDLLLHETAGHSITLDEPDWMATELMIWLKDKKIINENIYHRSN